MHPNTKRSLPGGRGGGELWGVAGGRGETSMRISHDHDTWRRNRLFRSEWESSGRPTGAGCWLRLSSWERGLDLGSFRVLNWGWLGLRGEFGTVAYEFIIKLISEGSSPDTICIQKPSKCDSKNLAAQPTPPALNKKKKNPWGEFCWILAQFPANHFFPQVSNYLRGYVYICISGYMCRIYSPAHMWIYMDMCVCICIDTHIHTHTQYFSHTCQGI